MNLISARAREHDRIAVHGFPSFFYTQLEKKGYSGVKRWAKRAKIEIAKQDLILVPVNLFDTHWVLAVINVKSSRLEYYDSLGGGEGQVFKVS